MRPEAEQSLESMDRQSLIHPFTDLRRFSGGEYPGRIIESGSGIRIRDNTGREFIDAFGGLYCVNIGYGRQEVVDAISEQARQLAYYHSYAGSSNEVSIRLSSKVLAMAPAGMRRIFFGLSGSDANETLVKIVWYYNNVLGRAEKKKIIARHRGYHGGTIMSGSLTGLPVFHQAFDLPMPRVLHTTAPYYYWGNNGESEADFSRRCAADLERLILEEGPETVAAFIAEPMMGTGGLVPPPEQYWDHIQPILKEHHILLIADEVVCGFGRMGTHFGCDKYDIQPDLMTVAKGLTSAYLPLSGAIVGSKVWEVLEQGSDRFGPFAHGYTYTAHPLCAAAALANLAVLEEDNLIAHVAETGPYLRQALADRLENHRNVGEVRGDGMLAAIEFVAEREQRVRFDPREGVGAKLSAACADRGLISRAMPHGDILGFAPPLTISREEIEIVANIVLDAVNVTLGTA